MHYCKPRAVRESLPQEAQVARCQAQMPCIQTQATTRFAYEDHVFAACKRVQPRVSLTTAARDLNDLNLFCHIF